MWSSRTRPASGGKAVGTLLAGSAAVQSAGLLLALLVGIQLARGLGPAGLGAFAQVQAFIALVAILGQFGLPVRAVRDAALTGPSRAVLRWYATRSIPVAAGASLGGTLIFSASGVGSPGGSRDLLVLAAGNSLCLSLLAVATGLMRGSGANLPGQAIEYMLKPAIFGGALFVCQSRSGSLSLPAVLLSQLVALLACVALVAVRIGDRRKRERCDRAPHRPSGWIGGGLACTATGLLFALHGIAPVLVASFVSSEHDIGVLRVALTLLLLAGLPASVANLAVAPQIARLRESGERESLSRLLSWTTVMVFGATAAAWLALAVLGRPLIDRAFGPGYSSAYGPALILCAGQLAGACFGVAGTYLNHSGHEAQVTKAYALAVPAGILSSFLLSGHGLGGIAAGTVVTTVLWNARLFLAHRELRQLPIALPVAVRLLTLHRRSRVKPSSG